MTLNDTLGKICYTASMVGTTYKQVSLFMYAILSSNKLHITWQYKVHTRSKTVIFNHRFDFPEAVKSVFIT